MNRFYAFLLLVLSGLNCTVLAQDPIRIGVITDLSGPASYYGNQTRIGVALAEKELREQGKGVNVIVEDSALSTAKGLSAAQKLIFIDKVDALFVDFTVIAIAVSSLADQQQKVMIYSAAAESVARKNKFAFKAFSDFSLGCEVLAREFIKSGVKKIGVLKAETEYGELCLSGAKKVADVIEEPYRQGENVASQILSFKSKGVEAVLNGCFENDTMNLLKAAHDIKYNIRFGVPEDTLTETLQERFNSSLDGCMTFGLKELPDILLKRAKMLSGENGLLSGVEGVGLGYGHIKQLAAAVASCPERTGDCISQALSQSPNDSDIGFEGWNNRMARMRTIIKQYSGNQLKEIGSYVAN